MADNNGNLGTIIKKRRLMTPLTLCKLASASGVSPSHLSRIEEGKRFPSARTLCKIAKPLGLEESDLFILANYLPPRSAAAGEATEDNIEGLDPHVAKVLSQEPMGVQRAVVGILSILKSIAKRC